VARALRRDHEHVDVGGRDDLIEVNAEAVGHADGLAAREVGEDLLAKDPGLNLVRDEQLDDVRLGGRLRGGGDLEAVLRGDLPGTAPLVQPDHHGHPAVAEVLRLRVALAAVADHGHAPPPKRVQVGVLLVVHFCRHRTSPYVGWVPRTRVTWPVRTISRMPYFCTSHRIASIL